MSVENEAVVRRFYDEMNNDRKNELVRRAVHGGPQDARPAGADRGRTGRRGGCGVHVSDGVNGHWEIDDIFSSDDKVVVRWTGTGEHVAELNGIPPTGKKVDVSAISIHRMRDGKIAETWQVWDTLGFLQQLGVDPAARHRG